MCCYLGECAEVGSTLKRPTLPAVYFFIHPLTLDTGNKLFADGTILAAFRLIESTATPSGVIAAHYE
jgi:hypothetical protein